MPTRSRATSRRLRYVAGRERRVLVARLRAVVNALSRSDEGLAELATICALFLREHRPETPAGPEIPPADARPEHRAPRRDGGGGRREGGRGRRGGRRGGRR